jgi:hypothetical protein
MKLQKWAHKIVFFIFITCSTLASSACARQTTIVETYGGYYPSQTVTRSTVYFHSAPVYREVIYEDVEYSRPVHVYVNHIPQHRTYFHACGCSHCHCHPRCFSPRCHHHTSSFFFGIHSH